MRATVKTKVKVKRLELLKVVRERRRKAEAQHKRALEAYPAALSKWNAEVVHALEKALADAKRGKLPEKNYRGRVEVTIPPRPDKPTEGGEVCNLRRMEKTLEMGADDTLLLSQEDADAYFGPCTL